jgi:pyruvate,water dikinase
MEFASPEEKAASGKLVQRDTPPEQRNRYSLTDADVTNWRSYALIIEKHYGRPMDIEWGKDGATASSTSCRRAPRR